MRSTRDGKNKERCEHGGTGAVVEYIISVYGDICAGVFEGIAAAKMGAITTKTSGVHMVGMFFFKSDANALLQLLTLVLTAALEGTFHEVANLFSEGENPHDGMGKIISFVGITGAAVDKIYSIGNTVINFAKNRIGVYGYYIGVILAFSGMLAESATRTLSGDLLKWADLAAGVLSGMGLIYSLWLLKKDASVNAKEKASPLISLIELGIGTCGVVSAIAKYFHDTGGG